MQLSRFVLNAVLSVLFSALFAACSQARPAYTELISPTVAPREFFGWAFGGLPDLTRDGVGEFYVVASSRVYVYDGEKLQPRYWVDSSCSGDIGYPTHSAGDLNGDGIPDLMLGQRCADQVGQVVVVDGASGAELFTVDSPNPVNLGFFGTTLRLLPDMTGDGKPDWLIHQPEYQSTIGRVYVFDSQTHEIVRTIQRADPPHRFWMEFIDVIPDVDGDGKPELLAGTKSASVTRNGQTFSFAGRAIVRSLQTGAVLYELLDPEPKASGWFGSALSGVGDINADGFADIAVGTFPKDNYNGGIYLFSGKDGGWLRTVRSPSLQGGGGFGRKIESLPDLNGDGVPELWTQEAALRLTHIFDGATSALLRSIPYPNELFRKTFYIGTVRQTAPPGISAYLFASEFDGDSNEGRVYHMPFTPLPKPPRLTPPGMSKTGFRFQVIGEPGSKMEIQGSNDFKAWTSLGTVATGNEPVEVEDSTTAGQPQRFYRAVQR